MTSNAVIHVHIALVRTSNSTYNPITVIEQTLGHGENNKQGVIVYYIYIIYYIYVLYTIATLFCVSLA